MNDTISRQAAIDAAIEATDSWEGVCSIGRQKRIENYINSLPFAPGMDCISRRAAIDICANVIDLFRGQFGAGVLVAIKESIEELPSAQPEIIRCKDCKCWVPGYITDNDDFIPPKCGEWQQMVGHSSDDYCSLAERREVTT